MYTINSFLKEIHRFRKPCKNYSAYLILDSIKYQHYTNSIVERACLISFTLLWTTSLKSLYCHDSRIQDTEECILKPLYYNT